jgi:hypothetical protein
LALLGIYTRRCLCSVKHHAQLPSTVYLKLDAWLIIAAACAAGIVLTAAALACPLGNSSTLLGWRLWLFLLLGLYRHDYPKQLLVGLLG